MSSSENEVNVGLSSLKNIRWKDLAVKDIAPTRGDISLLSECCTWVLMNYQNQLKEMADLLLMLVKYKKHLLCLH